MPHLSSRRRISILLMLLPACTPAWIGPPRPPLSGVTTGQFTAADGLSGRFRVVVPPAPPTGLLVFFPWDGAGRQALPAADRRAEIAVSRGLLLLVLEVPDQPRGNRCWWAPEVERYARYADALVAATLEAWELPHDQVYTAGLSGGADFAAAFFFHTGYRYQGGAVALCGGDVPRLDGGDCATEADPPPAPLPTPPPDGRGVRYDFAIVADDPLLAHSRDAALFHASLGSPVRHRVVAGEGHCGFAEGFDGLGLLGEGLDEVMRR